MRLGAVYILNPPWFFRWFLFPIVRQFMPAKLRERITLVYSNEELLKYFNKEELSVEYGGTVPAQSLEDFEKTLVDIVGWYSGEHWLSEAEVLTELSASKNGGTYNAW